MPDMIRLEPPTALFVSDIHLTPGGAEGSGPERLFIEFLEQCAARAERGELEVLYILGDLFSYWYESGGRPPAGYGNIIARLREANSRGLDMVLLPGNRDFLLGPVFGKLTGAAPSRRDAVRLTLGGEGVLLSHGDALAMSDRRHRAWRALSRGPTFRRLVRGLPGGLADLLARVLRSGSELEKRVKTRGQIHPSPGAAFRLAAAGTEMVIMGHFHEPSDETFQLAGRRLRIVTLGAWDARGGTVAEWDGRELVLKAFPGSRGG